MTDRDLRIDVTKGLLTVGMVFAHVVQLLGEGDVPALGWFSLATNLVSFSGFMFCFGYVYWLAYLSRPVLPWASVGKTALKCYAAYVISGVACRVLYVQHTPTLEVLLSVATVRDLPGYSEFLCSFAVVTALAAVLRPAVYWATGDVRRLAVVTLGAVLPTLVTVPDGDPLVGVLIGGERLSYFPVVQYAPLFLWGVWSARHGGLVLRFQGLCAAGVVVGLFVALLQGLEMPIGRFPPSVVWLAGSAGLFYLYWGLAGVLARLPLCTYLTSVGQNVLGYLLLSNIALFSAIRMGYGHGLAAGDLVVFFAAFMGLMLFLQFILTDWTHSVRGLQRARA